MLEVTLNLGPDHVDKYQEGVEAILRGPAPSTDLLRTLVSLAKEGDVNMSVLGLTDAEVFLFIEAGRLLQDLSETYKERGLF